MKLIAYNPSTDNLEKSYLSNSYAVGVTSIVVKNNDRFTTSSRALIGIMGSEKSEIVSVSAVNADKITLTVGATKFPHSADDPVYVLNYDQVRYYRSTTTVDGSYGLVATLDLDVDNSDKVTYYEDPTGLSSYFYKMSFYHSVTATESAQSDAIAGTGYSRDQLGSIINDFLTEVGDLDQNYMNVPQAINVLNECNDDLTSQSSRPYRDLKTNTLLNTVAGNDRIALPDDLLAVHRVAYTYIFGATDRTDNFRLITMEEMEYLKYDNTALDTDELQYLAIDQSTNELVLYPTPLTTQTGKFKLFYWKKFTEFAGLGDAIELPTPRVYKLFLAARFYRMRALHDESFFPMSDRYANDYTTEVVKLQRLNRLDKGTPMGFKPDTRHSRGLRR